MPELDPVLLSDARILAAYLIFFGSYFVFALGKFPWMKIDRPGAAIIGAVLMVAFRIVGAQEALQSIDFTTIVLLFSMMLVVANLRVGGFFETLAEWLIRRLHPHHLHHCGGRGTRGTDEPPASASRNVGSSHHCRSRAAYCARFESGEQRAGRDAAANARPPKVCMSAFASTCESACP
jgi:hypothetical protein